MNTILRRGLAGNHRVSALGTFCDQHRRSQNTTAINEPIVHSSYEPTTGTWQYIIADSKSKRAVIIDPVLDLDSTSYSIGTKSADSLLSVITEHNYLVERLLETHVHADHLTASHYLKVSLSAMQPLVPAIGIGLGTSRIQAAMAPQYGISPSQVSGAFDETFQDGDAFSIGSIRAKVLGLPGHTPDHLGYVIGNNVFVGDSIFNPDVGSARTDFPNGSASALWASIQSLLSLPGHFKLYTGHDYPPLDRDVDGEGGKPRPFATVEEHRAYNKHVRSGTKEEDFIRLRTARDKGLQSPKLLHQSLQVNILGGRFPLAGNGNTVILSIPVTVPDGLKV